MMLPPYPSAGERLTEFWGRRVVDCLRALTPSGSPTVRVDRHPSGTTYHAKPHGGGGGASFPWDKVRFGYALSGNVVTINAGTLLTAGAVIDVAETEVTLTGGPVEYVFVEHVFGSSSAFVGHSTSYPERGGNVARYALFSFDLTGVSTYALSGIHHMGDIYADANIPY